MLFGEGELEKAALKFRAAIALTPQARYYFNLCFLLNAQGQFDAALGACSEVANADGVDERLQKRTDQLSKSIQKKRSKNKDAPPPIPPDGPGRVASPPSGPNFTPPEIIAESEPEPRQVLFGAYAGAGGSFLAGDNVSGARAVYAAGLTASTALSRAIAGQLEVAYVQRGGGVDEVAALIDIDLTYLSFPILAKALIPLGRLARLHLESGVALGFLIGSATTVGAAEGGSPSNGVDLSFIFGGGVTLHRKGGRSAFTFDLRGDWGLLEVDQDITVKNRAVTFLIGFAL